MKFHDLSLETKEDIVHQIGTLLGAFSIKNRLGSTEIPEELSLFESCQESIIDLPEDWQEILRREDSNQIERWLRPQVTWYHQLRTSETPFGFARSIEELSPCGSRKHRVIEVVPSDVANEFQEAIRAIDDANNDSTLEDDETTAIFLFVPRYAFYGLAERASNALTDRSRESFSLVYPFFRQRLGVKELSSDRGSLITLLSSLPSAFGALGSKSLMIRGASSDSR